MGRDRDHEAGFTVVELAIVMMISMTVMASIVGMLHSQSKAERSVNGLASAQEQVRLALVAVQSDLRSAEPLVALPTASEFPKRMEIIHLDFDTDAMLRFRWRLDDVNDELVRETLDDAGNVTATTFRLGGVTNNTVFRYFNSRGDELTAENSTPEIIASCTLRVRVLIDAAPEDGPQPLDNWSDVQLRNRLPGGVGC